MMEQYYQIKQDYSEYLVLFQCGDFYEVFNEQAHLISQLIGLATFKRGDVVIAGIPIAALDRHLPRLVLDHQQLLAICDQVETVAEAKLHHRDIVKRKVVRLVTPGTLTDESLLNPETNNYLAAMVSCGKSSRKIGFAWADVSTGSLDTVQSTLETIESDLMRSGPKEILISESQISEPWFGLVESYCQRHHCQLSLRRREDFFPTTTNTNVEAHLRSDFSSSKSSPERACLRAMFHYLAFTQCLDDISKSFSFFPQSRKSTLRPHDMSEESPSEFMQIDASAWRALEISTTHQMHPHHSNSNSRNGKESSSLLQTIRHTVTASGTRLLKSHLAKPLMNISEILERQSCVSFLQHTPEVRAFIRRRLRSDFHDVERKVQRVIVGKGGQARDLRLIATTLAAGVDLVKHVKEKVLKSSSNRDHLPTLLQTTCQHLTLSPELEALVRDIQRAIKDQESSTDTSLSVDNSHSSNEGGSIIRGRTIIQAGYHERLDELQDELVSLSCLDELVLDYRLKTCTSSLKWMYQEKLGYCIEVALREQTQLETWNNHRENNQTVTKFMPVGRATKSKLRYKTPELLVMEENLKSVVNEIEVLEREILGGFVSKIQERLAQEIQTVVQSFALLDVLASHAHMASESHCCCPTLTREPVLEITQGRHLVVEQAQRRRHGRNFVANDIHLSPETSRCWIITGPNMGGKSTFLRQQAHMVILAQVCLSCIRRILLFLLEMTQSSCGYSSSDVV